MNYTIRISAEDGKKLILVAKGISTPAGKSLLDQLVGIGEISKGHSRQAVLTGPELTLLKVIARNNGVELDIPMHGQTSFY